MALHDPKPSASQFSQVEIEAAARRLRITSRQARNLHALAAGLLGLPEDYQHFDMSDFYVKEMNSVPLKQFVPLDVNQPPVFCGAVACAVGHGPSLTGVGIGRSEDWAEYADRVFGTDHNELWEYLFCGHWALVDNTPHGAARRILRALRRGLPDVCDPADSGVCLDYVSEEL